MEIGMRLTRAGSTILAKCLLGKELHFTRGMLGSGEFDYDTEAVFDLTEMRQPELIIPIEKIELIGDGSAKIVCHTTNAEVYQSFPAREHGIFALDPDTGKEELYSYCNVGNEYSTILNNNSPVVQDVKMAYVTVIRDCEAVTATLDLSFAYTSTTEFETHINSENPHPNMPNFLGNVAGTEYIWATDIDNHLHKISINNLKEVLRDDTAEIETESTVELSDEEKIFRAQNELGLNANVLLLEDFTSAGVTDNFKVKVTSSAEGGALLGLASIDSIKTGAFYTISDGYNAELVQIQSLRYNISGYHAVLAQRLSNSYDWNNTYLYRTTTAGADKKVLDWLPSEGFSGVSANIERTVTLETTLDKVNDFEIEGDGVFDLDGNFTLAR